MFKFRHATLIVIAGMIWLAGGLMLLPKGLKLLLGALNAETTAGLPLLSMMAPWAGTREAAVTVLVALGLAIGYAKGRFVLSKSVQRFTSRIRTLPNPSSVFSIFTPGYYVLIGVMVGLGISMNVLQVQHDIRGMVDVAIGCALINGSIMYFRNACATTSCCA